jgi:hypothetical protein
VKPIHLLIALALGASVLGGCGDDDDENGEALSKPEYIAQADAICKKANDDFNALFETDFPVTQGGVTGFFEKAAAVTRTQIEDLRALEPPEADREEIEKLLATGDKVVADFERAGTDPEIGAQFFEMEGGENAAAFDRQAKAYGFKECGEDEEEEEEEEAPVDTSGFSAEKRAYIRRVDALCREFNEEFSTLEERYLETFPPPLEAWADFIPPAVDAVRANLREVEAVEPPAEEEAEIEKLLSRQRELIAEFERLGDIVAEGDEAAFQEEAPAVFAASDELDADTRAFGLEECGSEGDEEEE